MAPSIRIKEMEKALRNAVSPRMAGVMALFYPNNEQYTHLLLILRKAYEGIHSNQIAFPGGKAESGDIDILDTALRETYEEVGVPKHEIEVICPLTEIYIPPSNFRVQPYIGLYKKRLPFKIQTTEVAALIEVSLSDFMDEGRITTETLSTSYAVNIDVPAFHLNGHIVWGATAMMLSEIKELLKQVL